MTQQQQSLTKHYPSANGVVGGSMPAQHGVVTMGRGLGRGRGRGMSAPARQPTYLPQAVAPTGVGRGIGSFTSRAVCCSVYVTRFANTRHNGTYYNTQYNALVQKCIS